MGLIALQQFSGQPSVISYAAVIFEAAGWNGHASVVTALLMLCVSTFTVLTVDHFGRKRLLYACCIVLMAAAFTLSCEFWKWDSNNESFGSNTAKIVVLIAMFAYIGGSSLRLPEQPIFSRGPTELIFVITGDVDNVCLLTVR
jgi:hypothetical protein